MIGPMIPDARAGGRPRKTTSRELVDAILYFLRAGVVWRLLPHDLPRWRTVYYYLRRWQAECVWQHIHHALVLAGLHLNDHTSVKRLVISVAKATRRAGSKLIITQVLLCSSNPGGQLQVGSFEGLAERMSPSRNRMETRGLCQIQAVGNARRQRPADA